MRYFSFLKSFFITIIFYILILTIQCLITFIISIFAFRHCLRQLCKTLDRVYAFFHQNPDSKTLLFSETIHWHCCIKIAYLSKILISHESLETEWLNNLSFDGWCAWLYRSTDSIGGYFLSLKLNFESCVEYSMSAGYYN